MLDEIKKMEEAFTDLGMKVGTNHTQCPSTNHEGKKSVSCHYSDDGSIVWNCFVCKTGGSIVDAWMLAYNMDQKIAINALKKKYGSGLSRVRRAISAHKGGEECEIKPTSIRAPKAPEGNFGSSQLRIEDATFVDIAPCKVNGKFMALAAIRWDFGDGKIMRQMHYNGDDWQYTSLRVDGQKCAKQPIYKMWDISQAPDDTVIFIVEGEKCMHSLQEACDRASKTYESFPSCIVTTNIGGSNQAKKSVWDPIGSRQTFVIVDNDEPSFKWAEYLFHHLDNAQVIDVSNDDSPKHYDIHDWLEDGGDVRKLLRLPPVQFKLKGEAFIEKAEEILAETPIKKLDDFLEELMAQKPPESWLDTFLAHVKEETGVTMGTLRRICTNARKKIEEKEEQEEAVDWPDYVSELTIKEAFEGHILYTNRMWWNYEDTHWAHHSNDVIKGYVKRIVNSVIPAGEYDYHTAMRKGLDLMQASVATDEDVLRLSDLAPPVINLQNGELHIDDRTGEVELRPHNPKTYLTHCLDISYDPDARCPKYNKAIREILEDDEDTIRHLHEILGYIIQPTRKFAKFFMFQGDGSNGKTSISEVLHKLCGEKNVCNKKIDTFGQSSHDNQALLGKILLLDDDVEKDVRLPDGFIKTISESKYINVNPKFKDPIEAKVYCAILLLCNHMPSTNDLSHGMLRRASMVPFRRKFEREEADPHLFEDIIANELPGILNVYLDGLKRLFSRGQFNPTQKCKDLRHEWLGEINNFYYFMSNALKPATPNDVIYSRELFALYQNWCRENDIKYKLSKKKIKSEVRQVSDPLGFELEDKGDNNRGKWRIRGFRINPNLLIN